MNANHDKLEMFTTKLGLCLEVLRANSLLTEYPNRKFPINSRIIDSLPLGTTITATNFHGTCNIWAATGRIDAVSLSGEKVAYFVKYAAGDFGRQLLASEFFTCTRLASMIPENAPKPIANGSLQLNSSTECYFLINEFVEFQDLDLADPVMTASVVSKLHDAPIDFADCFGTPMPMFDGMFAYVQSWDTSWTKLFGRILARAYCLDRQTNGTWIELENAYVELQQRVVPRLLDALQSNGRQTKPCFIHGDLWEGNIGTEKKSGRIVLFDSNGFYGHHEMELGVWTTQHHRMHERDYCRQYFRLREPSQPTEEAPDRVQLYSIKACLMYSAHSRAHPTRSMALDRMQTLLRSYPSTHENVSTRFQGIEETWHGLQSHPEEALEIIERITEEDKQKRMDWSSR